MTGLDGHDRLWRLHLRAEAVATEAAVSVFLTCVLLVGMRLWFAVGWSVVAGLLGAAAVQALRLAKDRPDEARVDLLGINASGEESPDDTSRPPAENDSPTILGNILAAVAVPFVAVFVLLRLALLYLIPSSVVVIGVAVTHASPLRAGAAWVLSVLAALANELVLVQPLARRHNVSLD